MMRELLDRTTLGRYLELRCRDIGGSVAGEVLELAPDDTVSDALHKLTRRGVLSAPVVDHRNSTFHGFCSVMDILGAFLVSNSDELMLVRAQIGPEEGQPGDALLHPGQYHGIPASGPLGGRFAAKTVAEVITPGADGHLLFFAGDPHYDKISLLDVVNGGFLHSGLHNWPTCHRVAVCEPASPRGSPALELRVSAVVTQSDIVRFLLEHKAAMGTAASQSVQDLGLVYTDETHLRPRGVLCVPGGTPALDAFGTLRRSGVSAIGVLDEEGALAANLSASDLRSVLPDRWGVLAQPIHRMLELQCASGWQLAKKGKRLRGLVAVRPEATLVEAMMRMVEEGVHHVFCVSEENTPLSVISTTDVLRLAAASGSKRASG